MNINKKQSVKSLPDVKRRGGFIPAFFDLKRLSSRRHSSAPHAALQAEAVWRIHDLVALGNAY